jgi:1-acyl-sn-glycerol-3-phosphate acyltransferase
LEVAGPRDLAKIGGRLIIANHPTLLDVVLLMALMPRAQCIVKHELWSSRYLGGVVRLAGYIPNNLAPESLLEACRTAINNGDNLIVFPEGTRTQPGKLPRFQRGFANIALLTAAKIQLITITCKPLTLTKGEPWWRIPERRPHFRILVGEELDTHDLLQRQERSLAARALVRYIETYYGEQLAAG